MSSIMSPVILTVTSDPQLSRMLEKLLSMTALQVIHAASLHEAAHYLRSAISLPQMVILDGALQDGMSLQFLRQMRAQSRFADLPALVIVAEPDPSAIKDVLDAGANRYLTHSFVQTNLLRAVRDMQALLPQPL